MAGTASTAFVVGSGGMPAQIVLTDDGTAGPTAAPATGLGGATSGGGWLLIIGSSLIGGVAGRGLVRARPSHPQARCAPRGRDRDRAGGPPAPSSVAAGPVIGPKTEEQAAQAEAAAVEEPAVAEAPRRGVPRRRGARRRGARRGHACDRRGAGPPSSAAARQAHVAAARGGRARRGRRRGRGERQRRRPRCGAGRGGARHTALDPPAERALGTDRALHPREHRGRGHPGPRPPLRPAGRRRARPRARSGHARAVALQRPAARRGSAPARGRAPADALAERPCA